MKILRIYTKLPPNKGGMEKHIAQLSREQIKNNHLVTIFFNDGYKVSNSDIHIYPPFLHKIRPQFLGIFFFYFSILIRLLFSKASFDVLHIHGDWSSVVFSQIIKKMVKTKVIVFSVHDQVTDKFSHRFILSKLLKRVDLIFSTGFESAQKIKKNIKKKVYFQPSGINEVFYTEYEKPSKFDVFQIITVANLFPKKNIGFIIELAKELPMINFLIIGDGPEKNKLISKIKQYGINNVSLPGFKNPDELKQLYYQSDCFLLTSYAEGTPTSILEAMACGLPVVSSNAGGIKHIIKDYENGFILDEWDKIEYLKRIQILYEDKSLRGKIAESNKKLAQDFKWSKVAENITNRTLKCYHEKE